VNELINKLGGKNLNNKDRDFKDNFQIKNDINNDINNNITLTINFGDSLNLIALIAGFFVIKSISKQYKKNKKILKDNNLTV
jgi:hypothetical protein